MLDELEERRLGPVDVVEDEDERPLARARLAEPAEEPGELGRGRRRLGVERGEDGVALLALVRLLERLAQRPVRDALAVGEAAAPERRDALRRRVELGGEARLADPGEPTTTATRTAAPSTARFSARRSAASSRLRPTSGASRRCSNAGATGSSSRRRNARTGSRLPLISSSPERLERGAWSISRRGDLADDDLVRPAAASSRAAIPTASPVTSRWRASVGVATTSPVSIPIRISSPTPCSLDELLVERGDPGADVERSARRTQRVVLVRDRGCRTPP